MNKPLVSICIPTYNGARFIAETMDSALLQTYANLEIVVSDDASKDDTLLIIEAYKTKTDIPIYIHHHKPDGIGANWNHTIKKANGKYIKFLFQDDVLAPNCIENMVCVMEANAKVGLVASKRDFLIEDSFMNEEIKLWIEKYDDLQTTLNLPVGNAIVIITKALFNSIEFLKSPRNKIGEPSVVLFKKELISELGYFDENFKQILDYEYWYRILKHYDITILNEKLVSFRLHSNQATNVNKNQEISDYKLYDKLLYDEYLRLLHPEVKKKLLRKYSMKYKMYIRIKNKIKRIING